MINWKNRIGKPAAVVGLSSLLAVTAWGAESFLDHIGYCELGKHEHLAESNQLARVADKFAPDRLADILHVRIEVTPNFKNRTVSGETQITFEPIAQPLSKLTLDAVNLTIESVKSTQEILDYTYDDKKLIITFAKPIMLGEKESIAIKHNAQPKQGLYFRTPEMGYPKTDTHIFTQGESHEHPHWFPSVDYPNEKFTSEVICHVPKNMVVVSNGRKLGESFNKKTGLKAVHWIQEKVHVNYLIALCAGNFKHISEKHGELEMNFYTPASQINEAQNSFKETREVMVFLEKETGVKYPWHKYDQVVAQDFVSGGMENTSLTILTDGTLGVPELEDTKSSQGLVAHELAHQWFGDLLTCKDWSHLWLNEGFATYYTHLYKQSKNGHDDFLYSLYRDATGRVMRKRSVSLPMVYKGYKDAGDQFDYRAYPKGSWVLHMLRSQLGVELYQKCIKTYLERNALKSVVTQDLNAVLEEVTGRSFDQFFDQYVYHGRHPDLKIVSSYDPATKLVKLSVSQTHEVTDDIKLFAFNTKVRFIVDGVAIDHDVKISQAQQDFYFPTSGNPTIVRFDPEYTILANVTFNKPIAMLEAQLKNDKDVIGRIYAIKQLAKKSSLKSVALLNDALLNDTFYGVRVQAANTLGKLQTPEAYEALNDFVSMEVIAKVKNKISARVRQAAVRAIGEYYRTENEALLANVVEHEKNPAIVSYALSSLAAYPSPRVKSILINNLDRKSYQGRIMMGSIYGIEKTGDASYVKPLMDALKKNRKQLSARSFGAALTALGTISKELKNKDQVREYLLMQLNDKARIQRVQRGALSALGELGDAKALATIGLFESDDNTSRGRLGRTAKAAVEKILSQSENKNTQTKEMHAQMIKLQEEYSKLKQNVESLEKQLRATQSGKDNEADGNEG